MQEETPLSFAATAPEITVFCPREGCDFTETVSPIDAEIAEGVPCPTCYHFGVTAIAKAALP